MGKNILYGKIITDRGCSYWPAESPRPSSRVVFITSAEGNTFPPKAPSLAQIRDLKFETIEKGFLSQAFGAVAPICNTCRACVPLRVNLKEFQLSKQQADLMKKDNPSLQFKLYNAAVLNQRPLYNLFQRYTQARHKTSGSDMHRWTENDFKEWLQASPYILSAVTTAGKLVGYAVLDFDKPPQDKPRSMISQYNVYDPDHAKHSLGIRIAGAAMLEAKERGVEYAYMGSTGAPKINYKKNMAGLETIVNGQWIPYDAQRHITGPDYMDLLNKEKLTDVHLLAPRPGKG